MASILAYIELREGVVTRPSRFAVAEARRVADAVGATVYALLTLGPLLQTEIDQLASQVSAIGADRILCSSADVLSGPPLDATHGQLLAQVAEHLRPVLFLFPAGGVGIELGPPLAVRIGAAYLANANLDVIVEERTPGSVSQRVVLTRWRAARDGQRRVDVGDLERPVVASLPCDIAPANLGAPYAEVEMLPCPESNQAKPELLSAIADSAAGPEVASALIWSATPLDEPTFAALPAGAASLVGPQDGVAAAGAASPRELFVVAPSPQDNLPILSLLAPGATVTWVRTKTEVPT
jgi:hypothetical protein